MTTGYAVFRLDPQPVGEPRVKISQVFWREEQAIEMVERLNALAMVATGAVHFVVGGVGRRSGR